MKKMYIGVVAIALLLSINLAVAQSASSGVPFQALWEAVNQINTRISNEVANLQNQINHISLTPGPKGDKGDKGEPGTSLHLHDANDQDLGSLINSDDSFGDYYVAYLPSENVLVTYTQTPGQVTLGDQVAQVYFTQSDCQGTPYHGNNGFAPGAIVIRERAPLTGQRLFKFIPGPAGDFPSRSAIWSTDGECHNNQSSPARLLPLEEISLPFSLPITQPLKIINQ